MFVSHDNNTKKKFQKPNILRRKSKAAIRTNVPEMCLSESDTHPIVTLASQETSSLLDNYTVYNSDKSFQNVSKHKLKLDNVLCDNVTNKLPATNVEFIMDNMSGDSLNINNNEEDSGPTVNVESFFNNGVTEQENVFLFNVEPEKELHTLVVIDEKSQVSSIYTEQNQDVISNMVPLSSVSSIKHHSPQDMLPAPDTLISEQNLFQQLIAPPVTFKCDSPNCNKEFRSEQRLKKHKNIHNKGASAPRQITVECPVKKINPDGTEQPCGKIYLVRDLLAKHLNEDHTLEDAAYSCDVCGRRFFWASGLRAHARSHCAGGGAGAGAGAALLFCAWPGCGRQFRQPCRLREHARAHTGDRPYPCRYPNCGCSFRSASKLERHARRHTGERRHACSSCGRAFLRRDHLRDHTARYHSTPDTDSPAAPASDAPKSARPVRHKNYHCTHEGCKQAFSNMSSLYMHMKKVHRKQESDTTTTSTVDTPSLLKNNWDYIFLTVEGVTDAGVEKEEDARTESEVEVETETDWAMGAVETVEEAMGGLPGAEGVLPAAEGAGGGAARTHRPWPLQQRTQPRSFVLEEDASSVEPSESSESNIYTVRSDLFLHGNVLINEDSEHMGGVSEVGTTADAEAEADAVAEERADDALGELGLLDTHPTIDLMQEELMYTVWQ
ncbi:LOW QUALITY PROTEIN: uncharacterized protein ACR2FA_011424 [Aphomia sociella]